MTEPQKLSSRFLDLSGDLGIGTLVVMEGEARLAARYFPVGSPIDIPINDPTGKARRRALPGRIIAKISDGDAGQKPVDMTWAVLAMTAAEIRELTDGSPAAEILAERFHGGTAVPKIEIETAVSSYLGLSSVAEVTDARLEQARAVVREIGPWSEAYGERLRPALGAVLIEGATEICSTVQDNDSETWFVTRAGQFVRVTGMAQDRYYVVDREEAKETLLGWVEDRQARMLFGDEAAKALFDEEMRRPG